MKYITVYTAAIVAGFLFALAFTGCTQQPAPTTVTATVTSTATSTSTKSRPPARTPTAAELVGCPKVGEYQAFDRVGYSDQKFIDVMRYLKMDRLAIRYCDWQKETLAGKVPTAAELAAYKLNAIPFVCVFQHNNNKEATYLDASRPSVDANRSVELYKKWGAPKGSAIYVGVDGDFKFSTVKPYVEKFAKIVRAAGYRVGMYGSGGNCEDLSKAGLIDRSNDAAKKPLCFIAASAWGWRGTKAILATKNYVIEQKVNQKCAGKSMDFDKLLATDVGQWSIP